MTAVDLEATRNDFVEYVRSQLVGPFRGPAEVLREPPNRRYLMGVLYPRGASGEVVEDGLPAVSVEGGDDGSPDSRYADDPVSSANDFLPSSQGLTLFTDAKELEVTLRAGRYDTLSGRLAAEAVREAGSLLDDVPAGDVTGRVWRRVALPEVSVVVSGTGPARQMIWDGRSEVFVRWRRFEGGSLVSVSISNALTCDEELDDIRHDDLLAQVEMEISIIGDGELFEYPSARLASHDYEEEDLRLLYRRAAVFAIGHGCSPAWEVSNGPITAVRTEVMPRVEVPRFVSVGNEAEALDIYWLASEMTSDEAILSALETFIEPYSEWIARVRAEAEGLDHRYRSAGERAIDRLESAYERMRGGVQFVRESEDRGSILRAFRLANRAILMQMRHSEPDLAGTRRSRSDVVSFPADYKPGPRWYPFQLGFFLTALRGLADPSHPDRELVDLLWFPTGGGKTEAYLLLSAFEILRRRIIDEEDVPATAVLSRYTLSLLTTQQFQRTASTIIACETLRRSDPETLGRTPISVGLWVGGETTPNRFANARESFEQLREAAETDDRFVLERCPWCGTEIVPRAFEDDDAAYGISCSDSHFRFNCPRPQCDFHSGLPVHVVDDDIYATPPSFLIGTVDKFAQLAWVSESGRIFGSAGVSRPPSLVLQDELHLLTGPLGTTFGLYESAIQMLAEFGGRPAKVVASTATIRRASEQVVGLFGRALSLFPPSGIDADDSYFATADHSAPGRLYVGIMAQGHSSESAVVYSGTALLQAPVDLGLEGRAKDAYWTLVAYHNSRRELGRTVTIANDDINARLDIVTASGRRRHYEVDELSAATPRYLQPRLLERLNLTCEDEGVVDLLATTNMLSVGVDVGRLGLMLVDGQPKTAAEYIQATSRVGRREAPGLVFGLFRSTKPRDRSHYENFGAFHGSLYRFVEPTSVTPWSPPSRDRALHAALVILVRHKLGLASDGDAGRVVDARANVDLLIDRLVDACSRAEPREAISARSELEEFREVWESVASEAASSGKALHYSPNGRAQFNLIKEFVARGSGRPTLGSMRNVDSESLVDLRGSR